MKQKPLAPADLPFEARHILQVCPGYTADMEEDDDLNDEALDFLSKLSEFVAKYDKDIQDYRFKVHSIGETRAEYWPKHFMELEFINSLRNYIAGDPDNGWKPKVRRPRLGVFNDAFFQSFLNWRCAPKEGWEYDKEAVVCDPALPEFQSRVKIGRELREDMPRRNCFNARYDEVASAREHLKHTDYSWVPDQYLYYWAEYKHPMPGAMPTVEPDLDKCIELAKRNELEWPAWVPESIRNPDYIKKFFKCSEFC